MAIAIRRRDHQAIGRSAPPVHLPREECRVLESWHPNVLMAGPEPATAAALDALGPVLRPSTAQWHANPPPVSSPVHAPETLIVRDLSTLSGAEQRRLLDWLKANEGFTQIVSASPVSLHELVADGSFDAALYYALNVVYFDLFDEAIAF
jgi:hypothetical protein